MSATAELRVMSIDAGSFPGGGEAVAAVVRSAAPDVLLVQDAPRFLRWRSKRAALARRCGLVVATADRPGGLCVMTSLRVDLLDTSFSLLPKTSGRRERAIVSATVKFGGARWRVVTLQLGSDAAERSRQLPAIVSSLSVASSAPAIVGGDLGGGPGDPVFSGLATRFQRCLDTAASGQAMFADRALSVLSCDLVDTAGNPAGVLAVLSQPCRLER
jgi:endonuclease/exonuclease/phosphatase family metal-dependent hydrolase